MKTTMWTLAAALCGAWMLGGTPAAAQDCAAEGKVAYLCGLRNAEDLARAPGTDWIITSSMAAGGKGGQFYLVDTRHKTWSVAAPIMSGPARAPYGDCPGPLDPAVLAPHGLALRPGAGGRHTLYAVNHGGRESIEVFEVASDGGPPTMRWIGCVIMPAGAEPNSVAPTPEGGFVVSKFDEAGDPKAFEKMVAGELTGLLYEWTPGAGFKALPGTALPGDNGVEVSPDGNWVFVNAWPQKRVLRYRRGSSEAPVSAAVTFLPDNLHWAPDGKLLVTGQVGDLATLLACTRTRCPHEWAVVALDPKTMAVTPVIRFPGTESFSDATGAIQVGNELWVGTYRGDRIAHVPLR